MTFQMKLDEAREEAREEGWKESRLESIKSVMNGLKYSAQEAMELLNIPQEDWAMYTALLQETA